MRVGVLLAGCGVQDGSEIYEAVLTILALERGGVEVQAMAPDIEQVEIINHYSGDEERGALRNVLSEAARIVRGKVISTREVSSHELDALVIPGGYGVVKNLCGYAADGAAARVNPDVERLIQEMHGLGKPIGAMCVGPILVALALRNSGKQIEVTVGNDASTSASLESMGARPIATGVDEIHIDPNNKIVSTAAFMLGHSAGEVAPAIEALVGRVLQMARENGPGHAGDIAVTHSTTTHN